MVAKASFLYYIIIVGYKMNLKQLKKILRLQNKQTTVLVEHEGTKYEIGSVTFAIDNEGKCYAIVHTTSAQTLTH